MPRDRHSHVLRIRSFVSALLLVVAAPGLAAAQGSFTNFETGQVRPLALSPDGSRLFAVNTPDARLEIFAVSGGSLTHQGSVEVGLEPTAVATRSNGEVWVVNHLSDSISIVDVATSPPRVVRTLLTCDEPRDIVFAGPGGNRAFVTTARRGQNCPVAANLTTEGTGRALVQVFDATNLGASLGGTPLTNVVLFGDTPRALARSADGNTVYAAVFHSGNQTTALSEPLVCDGGAGAPSCSIFGFSMPGGLPAPNSADGETGPETGLIVKFNNAVSQWQDQLSRNWNNAVRFSLPDQDVFAISASAATPAETANFAHVGTILFNIATNPVNGRVYVSNTEANNAVRFEGPGTASSTVQGNLHRSQITVLNGATVTPRALNKHIDYDTLPAPAGVKQNSLATPLGMAVTADGQTLYVTAFGSSKVGVFSTAALENNTFVPSSNDHIGVTGGGPTGIVLDEANDRAYVFTRFDNAISVLDLGTAEEIDHLPVYNPEPAFVENGRPFLYDAALTSSNGEASCSSCHVFGDFDSLAWDLGDPDGTITTNPAPFRIPGSTEFHPLKGPMTTQSLRGMSNHGAMHWRGDRNGGPGNAFDESAAFMAFNPAFVGLVGRTSQLPTTDMQAFKNFILTVNYPPNPIRNLDNSLTTAQQNGRNTYLGPVSDTVFNCNGCHTLDRNQGFFGSDGFATFEGETQSFKIAHLRNAYQKVGMFGMPRINGIEAGNNADLGPQVRGFGYLHDGSIDTLFRFLSSVVFQLTPTQSAELEQFVLAFDSEQFPIVGQQITRSSTNGATVDPRINLLVARASTTSPVECDLVVKGNVAGEQRGAWLTGGSFQMDRSGETMTDAALRALANTAGQELTYTCVPPGSGERAGVDRDEDGFFDSDERDAGSDPADPSSVPGGGGTTIGIRTSSLVLRDDATPPIDLNQRKITFRSAKFRGSPSGVVVAPWGSGGDPTLFGGSLAVYDAGNLQSAQVSLPAIGWKRIGTATNPGYKYGDPLRVLGPINAVQLRAGTLSLRGKGAGLLDIPPTALGEVSVRIGVGGTTFCASALYKTPGLNNTPSKFVAAPNTPPPAVCPELP